MWIGKGVLVGILLFFVGWITYFGIRLGIGFYRIVQMAKAGVRGQAQGGALVIYRSQLIHSPVLWITLLTAIAIGLWIMRARAIHPVL